MGDSSIKSVGSLCKRREGPSLISDEDASPTVRRSRRLRVRDHFREFCRSTSLHGLQYLGEENRPLLERVCWGVVITVSIVCCALVIRSQWSKWNSSPVIVSFSEKSTPVWQIPFPAITICSEVRFNHAAINFTDLDNRARTGNLSVEDEETLEYASLLCDYSSKGKRMTIGPEAIDYIIQISPSIEDLFNLCKWRGRRVNCSDIFSRTITDAGVCYTFNGLAAQELYTSGTVQKEWGGGQRSRQWSPHIGYDTTADLKTAYPQRTPSAGTPAGLKVLLNSQDIPENSTVCTDPLVGFQVLLHYPTVFPRMEQFHFKSPSKMRVDLAVHPRMMTTNERLRSYSPIARQCFFENERQLHFFSAYSQENCELECYTNYTLDRCKCVQFYMPRNLTTPICSARRRDCKIHVMYEYLARRHELCQCLPACLEVKYSVETSQVKYQWTKMSRRYKGKLWGSMYIFFKDMQIMTSKRSELYGLGDFLANCGGLLGLFLGFSILSVIEMLYFVTLRPFFNMRSPI